MNREPSAACLLFRVIKPAFAIMNANARHCRNGATWKAKGVKTVLQSTKEAMRAILGADPSLSDEAKTAWKRAIATDSPPVPDAPMSPIVRMEEASKLLGVTRQTLCRYARNGFLVRVKTSGGARSRGFTRDSVRALLAGGSAHAG